MSQTVNLGGGRLGSGAKMEVSMHGFERSTHDLQYIWRNTQAPGTIVPFFCEVGLPGDKWDIDLNCEVLTHPTLGPLYGSFKVQLDMFWAPVRLYQASLMINATEIGNDMSQVKLPVIEMTAMWDPAAPDIENSQINPSALFKYLGISGLGATPTRVKGEVKRYINALPYLIYWDTYKCFYANKQEEVGYYIHYEPEPIVQTVTAIKNTTMAVTSTVPQQPASDGKMLARGTLFTIEYSGSQPKPSQIIVSTSAGEMPLSAVFEDQTNFPAATPPRIELKDLKVNTSNFWIYNWRYLKPSEVEDKEPKLVPFDLTNLDSIRKNIMVQSFSTTAFKINEYSETPFGPPLKELDGVYSKMYSQEGLGIKTYQSDIFNNWLNSEWIENINTNKAFINTDTEGGFSIDQLVMANKVYNHFNRVAASDGTYSSWLRVSWDHDVNLGSVAPIYVGGLSKELVFQEVISTAETVTSDTQQPLGTLAGRGVMGRKHKGGKIRVRPNEIGYILGNISLTPRIDYSQGNRWDVNLMTMEDFHKPIFDQIGFEDLTTDKMLWSETTLDNNGIPTFRAAGKTVAWINYMTNYNRAYGNFAIAGNEMFMTLNRKYEANSDGTIKDLTTYIDPVKFNQIFAYTKRDAMNFWVNVGIKATARRKMSAKQIPNL